MPKPKYLRMEKRENWSKEMAIYQGLCSIHGIFENYLQGYDQVLECPKCQKERLEKYAKKVPK